MIDRDLGDAAGVFNDLQNAARDWRRHDYYLVSCRISEDMKSWVEPALAATGFVCVETLVTFDRAIDMADRFPELSVSAANEHDVEACMQIGVRAFTYDRYHADRRLPRDRADALKEAWVRNSMNGRADASLIVRQAGKPVGFNLCYVKGNISIIDLIAVSNDHRGRGVGRSLVLGAIA
ncbi:MAG: GNAT family N-acetyltransferase, partial [Fimbriimonadaceae bacterium]|nr:GNAT family N-acetyltransferase [Alphaproteobacteria bacterium]